MIAILGAIIFAVIAILTLLVTCGLPLGEFTLGGKYKVLPPKMRIISGISFSVQLFAIMIILQASGVMRAFMPFKLVIGFCFFFAIYLSMNVIMNFVSNSKKEKIIMTPLSAIAAICFWITAISSI